MKKTLFALTSLAILAIAMVSCMKESNAPALKVNEKGIKVNIISDMDSKTYVQDGDIPTVYWSEGDQVLLFETVDDALQEVAVSESAVIDGRKASFAAYLAEEDAGGSSYKYSSVYPEAAINWYGDYDEDGEDDWLIFMPNEQTLVNGNMALNSDILVSDPYDNGAARITDEDNLLFNFHRVGTVVRLQLVGITPGEKINTIAVSSTADIAGYIKYDFSTSTVASTYFEGFSTGKIYLNAGGMTATGDDVVWFRVYSPEDWEAFAISVNTDQANYTRDFIDASANPLHFINEGLTKFAVNLADYRIETGPKTVPYLQDFEEGTDDWTFFDADEDGFNWGVNSQLGHSGAAAMLSYSYDNDTYTALTPDNWAFTEPIQLTTDNYLGFWVNAVDQDFANENYAVYITTEKPTLDNLGDEDTYECLLDQTYPADNYVVSEWSDGYQQIIIPIPEKYEGKIAYIGFRHYDCTDMFALALDKVTVTEGQPEVEMEPKPVEATYEYYLGEWTVTTNDGATETWTIEEKVNGSSYTITGVQNLAENPYVSGHPLSLEAVYENGGFTIATQTIGESYIDDYDGGEYTDTFCGIINYYGSQYLDSTIENPVVTGSLMDDGTVKMSPGEYTGAGIAFSYMSWFQIGIVLNEAGEEESSIYSLSSWTALPCTATRAESTGTTSLAPKAAPAPSKKSVLSRKAIQKGFSLPVNPMVRRVK